LPDKFVPYRTNLELKRRRKRAVWQSQLCLLLKNFILLNLGGLEHQGQGVQLAPQMPARNKGGVKVQALSLGSKPHPISYCVIKRRIEQFGKMLLM
jgi:hypothetical protein